MKIQGININLGYCSPCEKFNSEDRARNCPTLNSFIEFLKRNQVKAEITECVAFKPKNVQKTEFEKFESDMLGNEGVSENE